jgi:hypothetical protein
MERSEIRSGFDASWQSRISLRSIRASVTGIEESIPVTSSARRELASVRDRHAAVA